MPPKLVSLCHTYYISHFTHIRSGFGGYEIGSMFWFVAYILGSCYYTQALQNSLWLGSLWRSPSFT